MVSDINPTGESVIVQLAWSHVSLSVPMKREELMESCPLVEVNVASFKVPFVMVTVEAVEAITVAERSTDVSP